MKRNVKDTMVTNDSVVTLDLGYVGRGLIYSIVCTSKRLVLVSYTTNLYQAIGRLMTVLEIGSNEYGTLKDDLPNCIVSVLETCSKVDTKKLCIQYAEGYKMQGYKMYKDLNPVLYTLHTEMNYHHGTPYLFVSLRSKRGDYITIGMFKKKKEAKEWIRLSYPDTSRVSLVVMHESMLECNRDNTIKKSSSA